VKTKSVNSQLLLRLRGRRSREVIAHDLRRLGHGTDAKSIWRYETGRNQPSARLLPDYAAVLGIEVASLFSEDGDSDDDDEEADPMVALMGAIRRVVREEMKGASVINEQTCKERNVA